MISHESNLHPNFQIHFKPSKCEVKCICDLLANSILYNSFFQVMSSLYFVTFKMDWLYWKYKLISMGSFELFSSWKSWQNYPDRLCLHLWNDDIEMIKNSHLHTKLTFQPIHLNLMVSLWTFSYFAFQMKLQTFDLIHHQIIPHKIFPLDEYLILYLRRYLQR